MRLLLLAILSVTLLLGGTFKLFLKDGDYHIVREYQVLGDRVRYFSTERGEWEEIPVALVDLKKTEQTRKAETDQQQNEAHQEDEEEKAERAQAREIASIPQDPGAYYKADDKKMEVVPPAEYQVITDKKRRVLQMASPVPLIPGKATVVIKGDHSKFVVTDNRPAFFLRLSKEERFGIIRLTPKKNERIVENIAIVPVAKQALEERKQMDTFEQELSSGLYRVWPEKPLTPGQYALVEFSDSGDADEVQLLVWDFAYEPNAQ